MREQSELPPATPEVTPVEVGPEQPEYAQEGKETKEHQPDHQAEQQRDSEIAGMRRRVRAPKKQKAKKIPLVRDELTANIERVMEAGREEAFRELSPIEQQEFKIKGEEKALEIRQLMKSTRVKVKKVFRLLVDWLKFLPGINRFFLEQEAKIKTDKILALKRRNE